MRRAPRGIVSGRRLFSGAPALGDGSGSRDHAIGSGTHRTACTSLARDPRSGGAKHIEHSPFTGVRAEIGAGLMRKGTSARTWTSCSGRASAGHCRCGREAPRPRPAGPDKKGPRPAATSSARPRRGADGSSALRGRPAPAAAPTARTAGRTPSVTPTSPADDRHGHAPVRVLDLDAVYRNVVRVARRCHIDALRPASACSSRSRPGASARSSTSQSGAGLLPDPFFAAARSGQRSFHCSSAYDASAGGQAEKQTRPDRVHCRDDVGWTPGEETPLSSQRVRAVAWEAGVALDSPAARSRACAAMRRRRLDSALWPCTRRCDRRQSRSRRVIASSRAMSLT
jgi:hypothetical protein